MAAALTNSNDVVIPTRAPLDDNGRFALLGISGSLRRGSYNRALLEAARELTPPDVEVRIFDLAEVPLYNGDVEANGDPRAVRELKRQIATADALLLATPEYNGAISGVLKNAIDWASRPPERALRGKPVALIGTTTGRGGTRRAQASTRQILENVRAPVLPEPVVAITQAEDRFDSAGRLVDVEVREQLKALLSALVAWAPLVAVE